MIGPYSLKNYSFDFKFLMLKIQDGALIIVFGVVIL
jgi:hypothetical protein